MKVRIPGLRRVSASLAICGALEGCAVAPPAQSPPPPPGLQSPFTGNASARYREPRWWLCMPGRQDACASDLDATELRPDGTRIEVRDSRAPEPGRAAPSPGRESVCVNPGLLAHGTTSLSRSFLAVPRLLGLPEWLLPVHGAEGVHTPFVLVRDLYEARCASGQAGFRYLAVSETPRAPGDVRVGPVDLSNALFRGELGTHLLDIQLAEGDLVDLVAQRAARLAAAASDDTPR